MEQTTYKKNAVFVSAGKTSLHRQLLKGDADFDLHLLIYDDSYSLFCHDTKFVSVQSGYKMDMTYRYLQSHPEFLENYESFFLMDDDIEMSTEDVNRLFRMMREYDLKIAQPSLVMSYYTYKHTARHPLCILRYTNFVEMMVPCFSKEALVKVLPTFEKKVRGCGIEFLWARLINDNHKNMAIVDEVHARHIRPLHPWSQEDDRETRKFFQEHGLSSDIMEYSCILKDLRAGKAKLQAKIGFDKFRSDMIEEVDKIIMSLDKSIMKDEILPLSLVCHVLGKMTEMQRYEDFAVLLLGRIVANVQDMETNLLLYLHLFENYTILKGRRSILDNICCCLVNVLDYVDDKHSPLWEITRTITKTLGKDR